MTISASMLLLASGLWLFLLTGCIVFAMIAARQRNRAEDAEAALSEQQSQVAAHPAQQAVPEAVDADAAAEIAMYRDQLERLRDQLRASEGQVDKLREDLERMEATAAARQGHIDSLEAERDMLQRQIENLSAGLAAGDKDTMREMIVNFTEESRELLAAIEQMGKEKAELQQLIDDMQAEGKGTAGTVIGLQRKLAQAEDEIAQLRAGMRKAR
ncbi:MAG: hypothetical protein WBN40_05440 [Pseudomonadales bacterium]